MKQYANFEYKKHPSIAKKIAELEKWHESVDKFKRASKREVLVLQDKHDEIWNGIFLDAKKHKLIPANVEYEKTFMQFDRDTGKLKLSEREENPMEGISGMMHQLHKLMKRKGLEITDSGEDAATGDETTIVH